MHQTYAIRIPCVKVWNEGSTVLQKLCDKRDGGTKTEERLLLPASDDCKLAAVLQTAASKVCPICCSHTRRGHVALFEIQHATNQAC